MAVDDLRQAPSLWAAVEAALDDARDIDVERLSRGDLHVYEYFRVIAGRVLPDSDPPEEAVGPDLLGALADIIESEASDHTRSLAAHAVAAELSEPPRFARELLRGWFDGRSFVVLSEGALVPCPEFEFPPHFVGVPVPRSGSLGVGPGETGTVRRFRAPTGLGHLQVRITRELERLLAPSFPRESAHRFATVTPNLDSSELHGLSGEHGAEGFPVGPADSDRQLALMRGAIKHCDSQPERPHILVFPELSMDHRIEKELGQEIAMKTPGMMVVLGSRHAEDAAGQPCNIAALAAPGAWPVETHLKLRRARGEGIELGQRITLIQVDRYRVGVLICADVISPRLVELLGQLGMTHLLVPACSRKTTVFDDAAGALALQSQLMIVVANNPCRWPQDTSGGEPGSEPNYTRLLVIARMPLEEPRHRLINDGPSEPGIFFFRLGDTSVDALRPLPTAE